MTDYTFLCSKCSRRVPTNQVRVLPGNKYICFECAGFKPESVQARKTPLNTPREAKAPVTQKTKYQCLKCKYEFYLKDGHAKKCPYCNGENIEEKTGAAQQLIDMHTNFRDDQ